MFLQIAERFNVDKGVPVVGDSLRDLQAGVAVGCKPYLVLTGKGAKTQADPALPEGTSSSRSGCRGRPALRLRFLPVVLIRNLLFMLALAVLTPLYALIAMATFPFGPKTRHRIIRGWPHHGVGRQARAGHPYRLVGAENIPAGPAIVMSKHMSAWDHHAAGHLSADGLRDEARDPQAALLRLGHRPDADDRHRPGRRQGRPGPGGGAGHRTGWPMVSG
jgi:hypothetical protein